MGGLRSPPYPLRPLRPVRLRSHDYVTLDGEREAWRDALDLAVREGRRRAGEQRGAAGGDLRQPGRRGELARRELARAARVGRRPGDAARRRPQGIRPDEPPPGNLTAPLRSPRLPPPAPSPALKGASRGWRCATGHG